MNTFTVTTTLSAEKIADQVITAVEGGIGYWAKDFHLHSTGTTTLTEKPWYSDPKLYADPDFEIRVALPEPHEGDTLVYPLTPALIQRGLKTMSEKYSRHLNDMVEETGDAITADVFIQCCIFGDLIYG